MHTSLVYTYKQHAYRTRESYLIIFTSKLRASTATACRNTYRSLTSDKAIAYYRDAIKITWIIAQTAFWLAVAAAVGTYKLGRVCGSFYWAELHDDLVRLAQWIATDPDRCITPIALLSAAPDVAPENEAVNSEAVASLDADKAPQTALSNDVIAIINSDRSNTQKLRKLAQISGLQWRSAHGQDKHLRNHEIQAQLQQLGLAL